MTILVETADRFSRDLMVQLMGYDLLKEKSIDLVPVDAPAHFQDEDNPTAELIRIMIGAVSQYVKKSLVKKLGDARTRKRENKGRCEGRKPAPPECVALAKELRAKGLSYREIGEKLSESGFRVQQINKKTKKLETTDRIYLPASVKNMIENL
jgi:DNA invertase Pin-like site-specific DNA recombinase